MNSPSPARGRPRRDVLAGARVRLEPVDRERHADDLLASAEGDPHLWDFLGYGPFAGADSFGVHLDGQAASEDPLFYAVVDTATGRAAGIVSYMRIEPAHGCIEIGHIWFGAPLQRTAAATETIQVLARHVFDDSATAASNGSATRPTPARGAPLSASASPSRASSAST